jgi:hypothetical protein
MGDQGVGGYWGNLSGAGQDVWDSRGILVVVDQGCWADREIPVKVDQDALGYQGNLRGDVLVAWEFQQNQWDQ